jgi:hypothetical protein
MGHGDSSQYSVRFFFGYYTLAMTLDCDLLRRYAETHSEDAFAELVRRHINLFSKNAVEEHSTSATVVKISQPDH